MSWRGERRFSAPVSFDGLVAGLMLVCWLLISARLFEAELTAVVGAPTTIRRNRRHGLSNTGKTLRGPESKSAEISTIAEIPGRGRGKPLVRHAPHAVDR